MKVFQTLKASWSSQDIRRRVLITFLIVLSFRILTYVPVPGISPDVIKSFYNTPAGGSLQFLNTFAGGTLDQFSILSVGLIPFINASVIFQLLPTIIKKLENMQKEGEVGRKKITQYTRILTVPLAVLTSTAIFLTLKSSLIINITDPLKIASVISILTAGSIFMMWMGEIMTEKGIGNGVSILIMVGILASIPARFLQKVVAFSGGWSDILKLVVSVLISLIVSMILLYLFKLSKSFHKFYLRLIAFVLTSAVTIILLAIVIIPSLIQSYGPVSKNTNITKFLSTIMDLKTQIPVQLGLIMGFAMVIIGLITLFNEAAKNLPIYFTRKASTSAAVAKKTYMPLKVLQAGVMPIIFANALLLFPYTVAILFIRFNVPVPWIQNASKAVQGFLEPQDWRYWSLNFIFTVFFAYFYTFVLFRPNQVADNLKKSGSYIPGIRPGYETEKYLTKTMMHLVFAGAMVLGIMGTTQAFIGGGLAGSSSNNQTLFSTIFTSGTSLLITVGVALDTRRQFRSYLAQRNYDELFDNADDREGVYVDDNSKFGKLKSLSKKLIIPLKVFPRVLKVKKKI